MTERGSPAPLLLLLVVLAPAAEATEVFYLPFEVSAGSDTVILPCQPLRIVTDDGRSKRLQIENPGGSPAPFEVKRTLVDPKRRVSRFDDCVMAVPAYWDGEDAHAPAEGEIGVGMPIGLALIALGPPSSEPEPSPAAGRWFRWTRGGAPASDPPRYTVWGRVSPARLGAAASVAMRASRTGRITSVIALETDSLDGADDALAVLDRQERLRAAYAAGMNLYRQGQPRAAFEGWLPLAREGHAPAQYSIADLYLNGEGVEPSAVEGTKWLRQAAEANYPAAQYHLGFLYATGRGVSRDLVEAYQWMRRAAALGHQEAQAGLERLAGHMSAGEIAAADASARERGATTPKLIKRAAPHYPEIARPARIEATVILEAQIRKDGTIGEIKVLRCSPPGLDFEEAAVEAVGQWSFEPAQVAGEPADVFFTIVVEFELI